MQYFTYAIYDSQNARVFTLYSYCYIFYLTIEKTVLNYRQVRTIKLIQEEKMNKLITVLLSVLTMNLLAGYQVGDIVPDITFYDSDGGAPIQRSVHSIIDQGKVLNLNFAGIGCMSCMEEAPQLETMWNEFNASYPGKVHMATWVMLCDEWADLNGSSWRTYFSPALTYYLIKESELMSEWENFCLVGYTPYNVIIGKDYKVTYSSGEFNAVQLKNAIQQAVSGMSSIVDNKLKSVSLLTSYPNPFNNSCTINYTLPQAAEVKVLIQDAQGRTVKEFNKITAGAGSNSLQFQAGNLASGLYHCRLMQGNTTLSAQRLLLLK